MKIWLLLLLLRWAVVLFCAPIDAFGYALLVRAQIARSAVTLQTPCQSQTGPLTGRRARVGTISEAYSYASVPAPRFVAL